MLMIVCRLADLATFVRFARTKYGIPDSTPWICFGGSYPGALSAWFRLKVGQTESYIHILCISIDSEHYVTFYAQSISLLTSFN